MDTSILQTYLNVVEEGSFAAAARRMGISRSLCSKHILDLEQHLGVRLLARTTRSVRASPAGEDYYASIKTILSLLEDANEAIRNLSSTPSGALRLSAPTAYTMAVLRPHMLRFMEEFPKVKLEAVLDDRVNDLVLDGIDAAIRIGWLSDSNLVARHLHDVGVSIVATPEYIERNGEPSQPSDISKHQILHFNGFRASRTWPFQDGEEITHQKIHPFFSSNNIELIRAAALDGKGLALLPDHVVRVDMEEGRLVQVLQSHASRRAPVHIVYPTRRNMSAALRAFVDFITKVKWEGIH